MSDLMILHGSIRGTHSGDQLLDVGLIHQKYMLAMVSEQIGRIDQFRFARRFTIISKPSRQK
jgi:hypothetical protein